ncbi:MAG TPA: hypothetical protein DDW31_09190 [candidate division Zixibacteria bacterium]|nr:hypothetical protein [candidate division Zixibacteria bacterium]
MKPVPAPKRILLVRTDRIGDVVLSLPSAGLIKSRLPGAGVHFLTRPYTAPLAAMAPDVDSVLEDEPGTGAWRLSRRISAGKYDAAVLLHPTARLAAALFLARIPVRIGTAYRSYSFLLNRRVPLHRRDSRRHELELNLELVDRGLGLGASEEIVKKRWLPRLNVVPASREAAAGTLGAQSGKEIVVVHPGSGGSARDWPLRNFGALIDRLSGAGLAVAVTLGPGEEALRGRLEPMLSSRPGWLSGLALGELAAALSLAGLVVSNSTGPLHIASAAGARALGIYCPVKPCLPRRWGPYGPGHLALVPEAPACDRCSGESCRHWDCMESLTVESVFAKALEMLQKP